MYLGFLELFPLELLSFPKKSICTSRTFGKMITCEKDLIQSITMYVARCAEKLRSQKSFAHLAHIFISSNHFRIRSNNIFIICRVNYNI